MRHKRFLSKRFRRTANLFAAIAVTGVLWLAVLPAVGRLPSVREHIARNDSLQIDPSAKFYSELPAMPGLLDRIRQQQSSQ